MSTTTAPSPAPSPGPAPAPSWGARLLRSRVLAALTSPHGVDRYLELVNPMWAAEEVRARTSPAGTGTTASCSGRPTSPAARCST